MPELTITERQARALYNSVWIECRVGALLAVNNNEDHLSREEMGDLERRLRTFLDPIQSEAISVTVKPSTES